MKCGENSRSWKQTRSLRALPEIVILNQCLGPFEFKIKESVLSPDISEEERSRLKYNICGFIVWSGSHYWAYTKDYDTGKWHHNDGYNDVYDKEIASDEKELAEEKVKKVFEKNRYIKDKFINDNVHGKPKVSVANVLFYARAEKSSQKQPEQEEQTQKKKDVLSEKVTQLKQSLEGLSKTFNDLKKSLADISKKLS